MFSYIVDADFIDVKFPVLLKLDKGVVMEALIVGHFTPTEGASQALLDAGVGHNQHISCIGVYKV